MTDDHHEAHKLLKDAAVELSFGLAAEVEFLVEIDGRHGPQSELCHTGRVYQTPVLTWLLRSRHSQ
jgi:hypothetical protein